MNIENIGGIPAHPLLVHAPVVLLPLLAVCVIVASIKANWHKISSIPLAILSGVVIVTSWLAKESGEHLEERIRETALSEKHAEYGFQFFNIALVVFFAVIVWSAIGYFRKSDSPFFAYKEWVRKVVSLVVVVILLFGTYFVYLTGHSGADSVWHDTPAEKSGGG
ncbi:MAG: DUF2231 domain-containing protein [Acidimicrobiia bacterium]